LQRRDYDGKSQGLDDVCTRYRMVADCLRTLPCRPNTRHFPARIAEVRLRDPLGEPASHYREHASQHIPGAPLARHVRHVPGLNTTAWARQVSLTRSTTQALFAIRPHAALAMTCAVARWPWSLIQQSFDRHSQSYGPSAFCRLIRAPRWRL